MAASSDLTEPARNDAQRIKAEQVRAVYRGLPLSLGIILINSSILVFSLRHVVEQETLLAWYGIVWLLVVVRWVKLRRFLAADPPPRRMGVWARWALLGACLSGAAWGATAILLWPHGSAEHQALLVIVMVGMTAGAISTLAPLLAASLGFIYVALLPLLGRFMLLPGEIALSLALLTLAFLLGLTVAALHTNRLVVEGLRTRFRREEAEAKVRHQAYYDELTNLPNRRLFLDRLRQQLAHARRHGQFGAVFFVDMDHFKHINDLLGHPAGDELLCEVARRLAGRFREEDTAARLSGDEFVILLTDLGGERDRVIEGVEQVARDLQRLLAQPYRCGDHELHLTASMGMALFPEDGESPEDIMKHADTAMYRAKEQGRDAFQRFLPSMQMAVQQRLTVEKELRSALLGDQLSLHYQCQVDSYGRLHGLEALLRWRHPQRGLILPGEFIPVAEETGLIFELSNWVLQQVVGDIQRVATAFGDKPFPIVSLNLSPREFRRPGFVDRVDTAIRQAGILPDRLRLEITESMTMDQVEQVIDKMYALKDRGISFSIDDFGTGYSSLAYLKRLPVDSLKIDRSFVKDILVDPNDAIIVQTIIAMADNLGIESVAEGVESDAVLAFLREKGCRYFQGWLFGRPEPLDELLPRLVAAGQGREADTVPAWFAVRPCET